MTKGSSRVEGEVRTVTTRDGYPLRYRVWSASAPDGGSIVLLNGVMSHSAWMSPIAEPLAALGYRVVGADRRGSGLNEVGRGSALSREVVLNDLRLVLDRECPADAPLCLAGWCWGAVPAIHAALEPESRVGRLALLAPGLFPSEEVRLELSRQNAAGRDASPDAICLDSPIREEMFTDGPRLEDLILRDERRTRRFTPRFFWNMLKMGAYAVSRLERLRQPVLLLLAGRDAAVDNDRTSSEMRRRLDAPLAETRLDSAHGMQFDAPGRVTEALDAWLRSEPESPPTPGRELSS